MEELLALPDYTKVYGVHTNVSNFVSGGVLTQDKHPIAFENRKLNDTKRRYTIQEKKMMVIIYYLHTGKYYLFESRYVVKNNVTTSYFRTQKKISSKPAY